MSEELSLEGLVVDRATWPDGTEATAIFSEDRVHRYLLTRKFDGAPERRLVTFVMLNPSTANALENDNTVRRCCNYARSWGFSDLHVVNLFAHVSTKPDALKKAADPIGPQNDSFIMWSAKQSQLVVAAWGSFLHARGRDLQVYARLTRAGIGMHAIQLTTQGIPCHPLYLAKGLVTEPYHVPVPVVTNCPKCDHQHIDDGLWRTKLHRTHRCMHCGMEWRPFEYHTVGVWEIPKQLEHA